MSNETCYILLQVENDLQELRGDLKTWLITQADEGTDYTMRENPFAYTVGARQMRFGDDFDHTRMARYDVSNVCRFKYIFSNCLHWSANGSLCIVQFQSQRFLLVKSQRKLNEG